MSISTSVLTLSIALLFVGCGGKEETSPTPPSAPETQPATPPSDVTVGAAPETSPAPPPPGGAVAASMPAANDGVHESAPADAAAQERIEAAMQSYVIDNMANPSSLEELVQKKYLRALPPAPQGKKWSYNQERLAVELVDL